MSNPKSLVPKLRFPEFREVGEWESKQLVELAKFRRGSFPQPYGLPQWYDDENGIPFVQVFDVDENLRLKEKTKNKISKAGAEQSIFIGQGALIVTLQGSIGRVAITQYDAYIDRTLLIFEEFFKPTVKLFFAYVIQNLFEIEKEKAPGGIIKTITKESLSDFVVKLPKHPEQQKIADCLSSLDDLISAQTQKIDALKTHKKGLMQQLLPAEGKTVPKRRFPEFREAGEWEEKTLDQISESIFDGTHQTPNYTEFGVPFYSVENLVSGNKNKFISHQDYLIATRKNRPELSDVLVTRIGKIGYSCVVTWHHEFSIYVTLAVIKKSEKFNSFYLNHFIQSNRYQHEIMSKSLLNAVPCKINMESLRTTKVVLPNLNEQQKIADCLSSLDELITAHTQKLDALKNLKKGLMQQLFPAIDEVSA
jgi:type I restriction enzyme S subunit